jgi:hypothetical protein
VVELPVKLLLLLPPPQLINIKLMRAGINHFK